jgi:hypothetical protein
MAALMLEMVEETEEVLAGLFRDDLVVAGGVAGALGVILAQAEIRLTDTSLAVAAVLLFMLLVMAQEAGAAAVLHAIVMVSEGREAALEY